jgi:5-methylthioadenosine/S-adenosylhomocysteine deaminase
MLESIKIAALTQKGWRHDPQVWSIDSLIECASLNGARALGLNGGVIEVGKVADIALINTNSSRFIPEDFFKENLIYSANSSCIDTLICNGKILMQNRVVEQEQEILQQCKTISKRLINL